MSRLLVAVLAVGLAACGGDGSEPGAADRSLRLLSLLFETDGRVVTTFRAGLREAVARPEGCA